MKQFAALILALAFFAGAFAYPARADEELEILSQAAVLIDADTGQILFEKDAHTRMYPASMTKIMTALLVIELCSPNEVMTVSETALDIEEPDSSNINLQAGEQLTVEQALYGLMLPSGNDAANALAEHAAGSLEAFTELMNEKAWEIGAVNTHFANAHGLHEDDHYTTAHDMALITAYAAGNEQFRDYFGAVTYEMPPTNLSAERSFTNSQSMLDVNSNYYNPDVVGGKTGFTYEAMYTLSTYASRDGRNLVSVVMYGDVRADTFDDTRTLLNFGFEWFYPVQIAGGRFSGFQMAIRETDEEGAVSAVGSVSYARAPDQSFLLYNSVEPDQIQIVYDLPGALTRNSDYDCRVEFRIPSRLTGVPTLLGAVDLEPEVFLPNIRVVEEVFTFEQLLEMLREDWVLVLLLLGAVLVVLALVAVAVRQHRIKKRRRNRQRRFRDRSRPPTPQLADSPPEARGAHSHAQARHHRDSQSRPRQTTRAEDERIHN